MRRSTYRVTVAVSVFALCTLVAMAFATPAAAQSSPVVQDSVEIDGSIVTIVGGDVNAIGVQNIPDAYYPVTDFGSGTLQESGNGIIWQTGGNVTFTLTPPESAEAGDSVSFEVKTGSQDAETVSLDVVVSKSPPKLKQNTITEEGSKVRIVDTTGQSLGIEGIPDGYYPPEDLGSGTLQAGSNGVIWPSGGNVSFTLTPPANATAGDTVSFDIKRGTGTPRTVSLEVTAVPDGANVEPEVYNAVTPDKGNLDAFALVDAIGKASDDGKVNGVTVTPFDFVELISWNQDRA